MVGQCACCQVVLLIFICPMYVLAVLTWARLCILKVVTELYIRYHVLELAFLTACAYISEEVATHTLLRMMVSVASNSKVVSGTH